MVHKRVRICAEGLDLHCFLYDEADYRISYFTWNSGKCSSSHGDRFIGRWTTRGLITKRSKVK